MAGSASAYLPIHALDDMTILMRLAKEAASAIGAVFQSTSNGRDARLRAHLVALYHVYQQTAQ
jgi:hypothetical protein